MSRKIWIGMLMSLMFMLAGCGGDTRESVTEEGISQLKKLTGIFKGVTDEASAKAAGEKIKAVALDMKALKEKMDKLGKGTAEEQKALEEKYKAQMEPVMKDFMSEMMRIAMNPQLRGPMEESMKELQSTMGH